MSATAHILVVTLVALVLPAWSDSLTYRTDTNDLTLVPGTYGLPVVEAAVSAIFEKCVFPDDFRFLRRLAYVRSHDGEDTDTYSAGGGLWRVNQTFFQQTQNATVLTPALAAAILSAYNITWSTVTYDDLRKPLYSGIAALLSVLYHIPSYQYNMPVSVEQQAIWANALGGDHDTYVSRVEELEKYYAASCQADNLDIAFILDSSGSIGPSDFNKTLTFTAAIVDSFNVSMDTVRVALVSFSDASKEEFGFTSHTSTDAARRAILAIPQLNGGTATDLAIDYATTSLFTAQQGSRPSAAKVTVIVTDGASRNYSLTAAAARALRGADVEVYAFGVGLGLYIPELEAIASHPECTHVKVLRTFSELTSIISDITRRSCDAAVVLQPNNTVEYPCGKRQTIKINPGNTLTIRVTPVDGNIRLYSSFEITTPNEAKNLFTTIPLAEPHKPVAILVENATHPLYITLEAVSVGALCRMQVDVIPGNDVNKIGETHICIINEQVARCSNETFFTKYFCREFPIIHADVPFLTYPNPCKNNEITFKDYPFSKHWFVYCTGRNSLIECRCPDHEYYSGHGHVCIPENVFDPANPCTACTSENWAIGIHDLALPWNRQKYVHCTGVRQCGVVDCGLYYKFDEDVQGCVPTGGGVPSSTPAPTTTPVPTTPRPTVSSQIHCEAGANAQVYYPYFTSGGLQYIQCENGVPYLMDCALGTVWDQRVLKCKSNLQTDEDKSSKTTTKAPTTRAPTTRVSTTRASTTRAPTTTAPTTRAPTTRAPTTRASTTRAPTTRAPTTTPPTTTAPTTTAPITTAAAYADTPTQTPLMCYTCDGVCSAVELLFQAARKCPGDAPYCLTTVEQRGGTRAVYKTCVDRTTCKEEWYDLSSDKTYCQDFDPVTSADLDLVCKFCCTTDSCNPKAQKPSEHSLYIP